MVLPLQVAVVPGDGIGPDIIRETVRVLRFVDPGLVFEEFDLGAERYLRDGTTLPDELLARWQADFGAVLMGPLGDPRVPSNIHAKELLLDSRFKADLYINFRPVRLLDSRRSILVGKSCKHVNFVVFRENTEGLYNGIGGQFKRGTLDEVAMETEMNTRKGVERIIRAAFEWAVANGKTRVCMSDKSNAMRHGHDLWQRVFKIVADEYPHIKATHLYVDVLAMRMVQAPEDFDVIVTNNLFGDIVTDLGAAIQGGIGLAGSGNIRPGHFSLFQGVGGSAPNIAGKGIANPFGKMLSGGMLLSHLGRPGEDRIQAAIQRCLEKNLTTPEIGGKLTTIQAGDAVLAELAAA